METLKEIFEQYQIYNDKGELTPLLESQFGQELFKEVDAFRPKDYEELLVQLRRSPKWFNGREIAQILENNLFESKK